LRRHADGHPGRRRQFHRNLRWRHQRRRRQLEGLDHQPDAVDPRVHWKSLRRQHVRRDGHRPDGQLPLHRDAGLIAMTRGRSASSLSHPMHKVVLFSIAALALLVSAAIAQTPEPEPAWRKSALALVPAGYAGGDAYRTDEAGMTGYLAVYPANANDPKSPGSVFASRQVLVVKLTRGDNGLRATSAELQP